MTYPAGVLGVPAVDWMYSRAAYSLLRLSHSLPEGSRVRFEAQATTVSGKRNRLARRLLASDRRWLLFVDSDLVVPGDLAQRLLRHEAPIVGGLYVRKVPPFCVEAGYIENRPEVDDPLRPTDHPEFLTRSVDVFQAGDEVVEVDVLATGMMLVRREVFEAMEDPWFAANHRDPDSVSEQEDWNFTLRARDAGFPVLLDSTVQGEHIGEHGIDLAHARGWWRERLDDGVSVAS